MHMQVHAHADTSDSYRQQMIDAVSVPQNEEGTLKFSRFLLPHALEAVNSSSGEDRS